MILQPRKMELNPTGAAVVANLMNGGRSPTVEESDGPYLPPGSDEADGTVIRQELVEQVYRIKGTGNVPKVDPTDAVKETNMS